MDTTGTVDAPVESGEATGKETPQESGGTGSVAPGSEESGQDRAGGEQSTAEGNQDGSQQARRRGTSPFATIRDLRAKLREERSSFDTRLSDVTNQLTEMKALLQGRGNGGGQPRKTFWEAPEEALDDRFKNFSQAFKDEILGELRQSRAVDQQSSEWKQETSEATKFIQAYKGLTPDDHDDIVELIRSVPAMRALRPMERAEYALHLWQRERGIGDKSALKAKASTTVGAPGASGGAKQWTESEIEARVAQFQRKPMKDWTEQNNRDFEAFEREVKAAYQEGRVK